MSHRNLSSLGKDIQDRLKKLEYGELDSALLDDLVEDTRVLFETLTILRYRFHEEKVKAKNKEKQLEGEIPVLFKMESDAEESRNEQVPQNPSPQISPNQTSLIDAIEEVQSEEKDNYVEPVTEKPDKKVEAKEIPVSKNKDKVTDKDEPSSLVEKMEKAPIENLKKEITLNLKFRFINELFLGNADEYNAFIDQLDKASNLKEAEGIVKSNGSSKHSWDPEMEEVILFQELVERRFL